jgi:hypothetical protein
MVYDRAHDPCKPQRHFYTAGFAAYITLNRTGQLARLRFLEKSASSRHKICAVRYAIHSIKRRTHHPNPLRDGSEKFEGFLG